MSGRAGERHQERLHCERTRCPRSRTATLYTVHYCTLYLGAVGVKPEVELPGHCRQPEVDRVRAVDEPPNKLSRGHGLAVQPRKPGACTTTAGGRWDQRRCCAYFCFGHTSQLMMREVGGSPCIQRDGRRMEVGLGRVLTRRGNHSSTSALATWSPTTRQGDRSCIGRGSRGRQTR